MIEYLENIGLDISEIEELFRKYDKDYLNGIDIENLSIIYNLLKKELNNNILKNILENNIEIFTYPEWYVKEKISKLKNKYKDYKKILENNIEIIYEEC